METINPTPNGRSAAAPSTPKRRAREEMTPGDDTHAVAEPRQFRVKNILFTVSMLLFWLAARYLFIRMHVGGAGGPGDFMKYDVIFIILPASLTFFMNWYWLREQRTDTMIRSSLAWAAFELILFILLAVFAAAPLHSLLTTIGQQS